MQKVFPIVVVTLALIATAAAAQQAGRYDEYAERIFREGLARLAADDFQAAYEKFSLLVTRRPMHQRTTAAYVMGAKALFRLRQFDKSIQLLQDFLRLYRSSRYLPDAHFTLALDYHALKRHEDSVNELMKVLEGTQERNLSTRSEQLLSIISNRYLDERKLERFHQTATVPAVKFLLGVELAEKWVAEGKTVEARSVLLPLLQRYPGSRYAARAREILANLERVTLLKIGVVLPLFHSSSDPAVRQIGEEIRRGIEFAVEEFHSPTLSVELKVLDSEGEPSSAATAVHALAKDKEILAILGPIYSAEVSAAAKAANDSGVPLITPTANANGLASAGLYTFQANPDYSTRGKAMARCALQNLGLHTFAVLAPIDTYGRFMAESFVEEATRLGGKVLGVEWYQKGATDFQEQLMRLRTAGRLESAPHLVSFARKVPTGEIKKLLARGVPRRVLDSLISSRGKIYVKDLLGEDGKRIADSLGIPTEKQLLEPDSLGIPVTEIAGFYLPIAGPEEIGILSAQLAYHNFEAQLLGSGDWYNPEELDANRRYTDGVIFDSDTYADPTDSTYLKFFDRFYQKTNARPTKNTLLGYDAAQLIFGAAIQSLSSAASPGSGGIVTRERIAEALRRMVSFRGLHSMISFNRGRVNSALNILQYRGGEVRKLAEILVQDER